jgi:hypothetical protein
MDIGSSLVALPLGAAKQAGVNPDNARPGGVNAANGLARLRLIRPGKITIGHSGASRNPACLLGLMSAPQARARRAFGACRNSGPRGLVVLDQGVGGVIVDRLEIFRFHYVGVDARRPGFRAAATSRTLSSTNLGLS